MGGCGDRRGRGGRSRGGRSRGGRSRGGRSRGGREGREGRKDGISRRIVRENGSGSASALFCRRAIPGLLPVVSFSNSSTNPSTNFFLPVISQLYIDSRPWISVLSRLFFHSIFVRCLR